MGLGMLRRSRGIVENAVSTYANVMPTPEKKEEEEAPKTEPKKKAPRKKVGE